MSQFYFFRVAAAAEMRSARRLARTWLFAIAFLIASVVVFLVQLGFHAMASGSVPSMEEVHPRFLMGMTVSQLNAILVVAIIFLGQDVRSADRRSGMSEVIGCRPIGNLALLAGRLAGLVMIVWLPLAVTLLLLQAIGAALLAFDAPIGGMIEPVSVAALLLVDAPPLLVLWGALTILLAAASRNRIAAMLVALALFGAWLFWSVFYTPLYISSALSAFPGSSQASDLLPYFADGPTLVQRLGMCFLAAGFLVVAAALDARLDRHAPGRQCAAGLVITLVSAGLIGALAWQSGGELRQRDAWAAAHEALRDAPRVDIEHVRGSVRIEPGDALELQLDYRIGAPPGAGTERVLLSFNPGMAISELRVDGEPADFSHEDGLLAVPLDAPLRGDARIELSLAAHGVLDPSFAYLDAALDVDRMSGADAGTLPMLGTQASLFESDYVALMPGVQWLPTAGAAFGRDDLARYGRDYFSVDLAVDVPTAWLVAGPGRREGADGRFRFRPQAPVPEVALLAARFERRAMMAGGVEFELLMSPKHLRNVDRFADAAQRIRSDVEEALTAAGRIGLRYPYGGFSLVEVPNALRGYGGGWRMPSVLSAPGIAMLREVGFPTARFDQHLDDEVSVDNSVAVKVRTLSDFFNSDFSGSNPLHSAVRQFLAFQTGAAGRGAIAIDAILQDLAARVLGAQSGEFFSAHALTLSGKSDQESQLGSYERQGGVSVFASMTLSRTAADRPQVWDRVQDTALADLDPATDPRAVVDILWLKAPRIAESLFDILGREASAALLAELRSRHAGGTFTAQQFAQAAGETGADIESIVGDWLNTAQLPGYRASQLDVARLADDAHGTPRYQLRVHVRNTEPVPGVVRLRVVGDRRSRYGAPVRIGGGESVEIGMVANAVPSRVWLHPALSLNRRPLSLGVPEVDASKSAVDEPFNGTRPSAWRPSEDGIVIDDLSPGFRAYYADSGTDARKLPEEISMDQGLPVFSVLTARLQGWTRQALPGSYGIYRRTFVRVPVGDGSAKAEFAAALPRAGRWRLDYHVPDLRRADAVLNPYARSDESPVAGLGVYDIGVVTDSGGSLGEVDFDASAGQDGWNALGEFELPAGEVTVTVSNRTSGTRVVADAIRWHPVVEIGD